MKIFLVLAALVSALLASLVSHQVPRHSGTSSQAPALPPMRIVRSPQAPKIVRPVRSTTEPATSPAHSLARPLARQHKA